MKTEKIKEYRMKKCLSQTELAKILDIDRSYLSQIENGKQPSLKLLERIADALGRNLKDFF
jgi:transcriptional regulator with XRE-family HTH domain